MTFAALTRSPFALFLRLLLLYSISSLQPLFAQTEERQHVSSGTKWEQLYGYSRAVRVGNSIHVAGTVASGSNQDLTGDAAGQARFALKKIETSLQQLGSSLEDVVRTRIYVTSREYADAVATVHGEIFHKIRPAATLVIADLIEEEYLVEIEAEAIISSSPQIEKEL